MFNLLVGGAFVYLALNAGYNMARMGLVAGFILGWNLGPCLGQLLAASLGKWQSATLLSCACRIGFAGLLLTWGIAFVTGRYQCLDERQFGFGEHPLYDAHDAARFAGQVGMPERALVYDIRQASVFVFENAPGHKPFMDPRLEIIKPETFRIYRAIEHSLVEQEPTWDRAIRNMGNPSLLLWHNRSYAYCQAAVLTHPDWRLVYFDALAAVFLPRTDAELEARFPTLDLASRHFCHPRTPSIPNEPQSAHYEAVALLNLGLAIPASNPAVWQWRVPVLLAGIGRAARAVEEAPERADNWKVLGHYHWNLLPTVRPVPSSVASWGTCAGLPCAQAAFCFRRALEVSHDDVHSLGALYTLFAAQGIYDAQQTLGERLRRLGRLTPEQDREMQQLSSLLGPPDVATTPVSPPLLLKLLEQRRPEAIARHVEEAGSDLSWPWPLADRMAGACLQIGRPELARRLWQQAKGPPSEATRLTRVAATYWVEHDLEMAVQTYRQAHRLDRQSLELLIPLSWLHAELGEGAAALAVCQEALGMQLTQMQRAELQGLHKLLRERVPSGKPDHDRERP